jgi:hypothetical protein
MSPADPASDRRSWGILTRRRGQKPRARVFSTGANETPVETGLDANPVSPPSLAGRIRAVEAELLELRQQQRHELLATIAATVEAGCVFSARELWSHAAISPALNSGLIDAGIRSPRQLGKRLRQMAGAFIGSDKGTPTLERVGVDRDGAVWCWRL